MKSKGQLIRELQDAVLEQQREIRKLKETLYDRTRVRYGPEKPLLVVDAIELIRDHLNLRIDYVYPDESKTGWVLVPKEDDPEK